jgi:hypothetical protein
MAELFGLQALAKKHNIEERYKRKQDGSLIIASQPINRAVNGSDSNRIPEDSNANPLKIYKIYMRIRIQ